LAAVFAAVGWFLVFWLRPLIKSVPLLPLGSVTTGVLVIGVVAFAIAGLLIAGALFFASPWTRWGDAIPGTCPAVRQADPATGEGRTLLLGGRQPRGRDQEGAPGDRDPVQHPWLPLRHDRNPTRADPKPGFVSDGAC
jgi:hypothetical protein